MGDVKEVCSRDLAALLKFRPQCASKESTQAPQVSWVVILHQRGPGRRQHVNLGRRSERDPVDAVRKDP